MVDHKIRHYYVIYTKVINRTSLKSFRKAVTQQKRTAPQGVDAVETVRFSWKVVEPQEQREHDVRVSQAMRAWFLVHMDGNVKAAPS